MEHQEHQRECQSQAVTNSSQFAFITWNINKSCFSGKANWQNNPIIRKWLDEKLPVGMAKTARKLNFLIEQIESNPNLRKEATFIGIQELGVQQKKEARKLFGFFEFFEKNFSVFLVKCSKTERKPTRTDPIITRSRGKKPISEVKGDMEGAQMAKKYQRLNALLIPKCFESSEVIITEHEDSVGVSIISEGRQLTVLSVYRKDRLWFFEWIHYFIKEENQRLVQREKGETGGFVIMGDFNFGTALNPMLDKEEALKKNLKSEAKQAVVEYYKLIESGFHDGNKVKPSTKSNQGKGSHLDKVFVGGELQLAGECELVDPECLSDHLLLIQKVEWKENQEAQKKEEAKENHKEEASKEGVELELLKEEDKESLKEKEKVGIKTPEGEGEHIKPKGHEEIVRENLNQKEEVEGDTKEEMKGTLGNHKEKLEKKTRHLSPQEKKETRATRGNNQTIHKEKHEINMEEMRPKEEEGKRSKTQKKLKEKKERPPPPRKHKEPSTVYSVEETLARKEDYQNGGFNQTETGFSSSGFLMKVISGEISTGSPPKKDMGSFNDQIQVKNAKMGHCSPANLPMTLPDWFKGNQGSANNFYRIQQEIFGAVHKRDETSK